MSWIVHTKGGPGLESFEIAVLREDNEHGIRSYGWFGDRKILISHSGGPGHWPLIDFVWKELLGVAERTAAHLNEGEKL